MFQDFREVFDLDLGNEAALNPEDVDRRDQRSSSSSAESNTSSDDADAASTPQQLHEMAGNGSRGGANCNAESTPAWVKTFIDHQNRLLAETTHRVYVRKCYPCSVRERI